MVAEKMLDRTHNTQITSAITAAGNSVAPKGKGARSIFARWLHETPVSGHLAAGTLTVARLTSRPLALLTPLAFIGFQPHSPPWLGFIAVPAAIAITLAFMFRATSAFILAKYSICTGGVGTMTAKFAAEAMWAGA